MKNQAGAMWACDFTVVYDWLFRAWYIFVVLANEQVYEFKFVLTHYKTRGSTAAGFRRLR